MSLAEIDVDNFAGGGGASTGIEAATGRPVALAIVGANSFERYESRAA